MIYQLDQYRDRRNSEMTADFDLSDRTPPHSIEDEIEVLGSILLDSEAIARVIGILKPEHFYISAHREIYKAMVSLHIDDLPTDLMQVYGRLTDLGLIEVVGGKSQLSNLFDSVISAVHIDLRAAALVERWKRRQLIQVCQTIQGRAYDLRSPVERIVFEAEERIFGLTDSAQQKGLRPLADILMEEFARLEAVGNGETAPGTPTGFYDLDDKIKGLRPQKLIIVAGRPSMGKSAWAAAVARNVANSGKAIALFSLEMSEGEVAQRLWASESSVDSGNVQTGELSLQEWESLGSVASKLTSLNIHIDESQDVTPSHILTQCRRLRSEKGELGLVIVDYLHLMLDGQDDEVRELGRITRAFKKMSRALDCPIMLLSQLSRAVENRTDKRPVMADLRQSGSIEQDADIILMLYRDEYYNPETPDQGIAEVLIRKNRGGAIGTVKLLFEPKYSRFRNLARRNDGFDEMRVVRQGTEQKRGDRANKQPKAAVSPQLHDAAPAAHEATQSGAESDSVDGWNVGDIALVAVDHLDDYSQKEMIKNNEAPVGQKVLILEFKYNAVLEETFAIVRLPNGDRKSLTTDFFRRVES